MKNLSLSREIKKRVLTLIVFVAILAASWICIRAYAGGEPQRVNKPSGSQLQTSLVCMINNEYMAKEQIPTVVNGKTYYGCCPACAENLKNNQTTRYAEDPYSNEQVDKADAFIALQPDSTTKVQYFKSEQSYINYLKSSNTNNLRKSKSQP